MIPESKNPTRGICIPPGGTVGMVGGGQLGRMFAIAAAKLGYRVGVFCGSSDEPAAGVAAFTVCGPLDDHSAIENFARLCDVITLEFENIPAETISACSRHAPTYPDSSVLAIAQDRWLEKTTLRSAGLPVTPFEPVNDATQAIRAGQTLGWPLIIKTNRCGYDGKGQHRLNQPDDAQEIDFTAAVQTATGGGSPETAAASSETAGGANWIAEAMIDFRLEISVVVARTADGRTRSFPVFENRHHNHILDLTVLPASISEELEAEARRIAMAATDALGVVGLLCVEMFVAESEQGPQIMINEVAPRPHNSGHVSIEACHTSQFEQHVRAICGLPLGDTRLITPAAAMLNLLGDLWGENGESPDWKSALEVDGVSLHLYGKHAARPGRKMGHLTAVGQNREEVIAKLQRAREALK